MGRIIWTKHAKKRWSRRGVAYASNNRSFVEVLLLSEAKKRQKGISKIKIRDSIFVVNKINELNSVVVTTYWN